MNSRRDYGIIWDVDGTLVDTAKLHFDAWVRMAQELRRPFTTSDFANTFGRRNPEIIQYLFGEHYSEEEVAELGETKENYYRAEAKKIGIDLLPGVQALLEAFHAAGIPQGVGSSAPRGNLHMILEMTKSGPFFQAIIGMEDTKKGKPDPEVFLNAARDLGIPPERCLVFEDAVAGIQGARAGGMKAVGVTFVGHHSAEKLQAAGAHRVVNTLSEITVEEVLRLIDQA